LDGLRVIVDVGNGATYKSTPCILRELGAQVTIFNNTPDGTNINDHCGSMHPEVTCQAVRAMGADIGIAHDGDGDRVLLCDEKGSLVDGDDILAITALDALSRGALTKNTLVATVMSNLGLDFALNNAGGKVVRTAVGDRYVLEEMIKGDYNVGGEQSGHMIFRDYTTTGDGIISALQVLRILIDKERPLSELCKVCTKFPQVLINMKVKEKPSWDTMPDVLKLVKEAEEKLGKEGRVFLRYSGTEPKARLLIEGRDQSQIEAMANRIAGAINQHIGIS
jgi:phosphoglucosamine mutase